MNNPKNKKSYHKKSRYDIILSKPGKIVRRHPASYVNIIWAEGLDKNEIENLREQVDLALTDPDYSIISNYEIHWERIPVHRNSISRVVWAEDLDSKEIEELKEMVDQALADPEFAIITNYEVHWNEILK